MSADYHKKEKKEGEKGICCLSLRGFSRFAEGNIPIWRNREKIQKSSGEDLEGIKKKLLFNPSARNFCDGM